MAIGGSTPDRGPYGEQVSRVTDFLLSNTDESGFISVDGAASHGPMYGHGFATLFLAEVYGMSPRDDLRDKLSRAIDLIVRTQNDEGGWRYQPRRADADLSVTICQVMALRAARNAGLRVPNETVDKCVEYVRKSQNPDGGFRYMLPMGRQPVSALGGGRGGALQRGHLRRAGDRAGADVSRPVLAARTTWPNQDVHFFYGQYYARAGDVAGRRQALGALVSGDPQCARRPATAGRLVGRSDLRRIRHGDGDDRAADAGEQRADISAVAGMIYHGDTESTEKRTATRKMQHVARSMWDRLVPAFTPRFALSIASLCTLCLRGEFLLIQARASEPVVVSVSGEPVEGKFVGFSADGRVNFLGKTPFSIPLDELVRWGHPALPRPQTLVLLADGSRLVTAADWSGGAAVQFEGEAIVVRSVAWDECEIYPRA